jgi:hypothetical protein
MISTEENQRNRTKISLQLRPAQIPHLLFLEWNPESRCVQSVVPKVLARVGRLSSLNITPSMLSAQISFISEAIQGDAE